MADLGPLGGSLPATQGLAGIPKWNKKDHDDLSLPTEPQYVPLEPVMAGSHGEAGLSKGHGSPQVAPPSKKRRMPEMVPRGGTIIAAIEEWEPNLERTLRADPTLKIYTGQKQPRMESEATEDATATYQQLYGRSVEHLRHYWPLKSNPRRGN